MIPTAILAADLHFRADVPKARIDDFQAVMWGKWEAILDLSAGHNSCPILVAGDLGHKAEWPNWLLEKFMTVGYDQKISFGEIIVVPGQHDLPNHSMDALNKSALGVLAAAGKITLLHSSENYDCGPYLVYSYPWGFPIENVDRTKQKYGREKKFQVAMTHQLVIEGNVADWPGQQCVSGLDLLKRFPEYDLILSGDNHIPFTVEYEGRLLVNPGSMMRTTADQISHKPRVYLWYAEERYVEPYYLPIQRHVLSREHLEIQAEKDKRMEAFVTSVKQGGEIKLSFEDNMEAHLKANSVSKPVETKIWKAVQG